MKSVAWTSLTLTLFLAGCVPYPGMQSAVYTPAPMAKSSFGPIGLGSAHAQSQHFFLEAEGADAANKYSSMAESVYNHLMIDAGMMSYQPGSGFKIVIYPSADEFDKKTGSPSGSRGVIFRGALYTYADAMLNNRLSYEITRMVLTDYIKRPNSDWLWVRSGLAAYEEVKTIQEAGSQRDLFAMARGEVKQNPMPIDQLTNMVPAGGMSLSSSPWDCQAESMVAFMIAQGGSGQFGQFLGGLQANQTMDAAISQAFAGKWSGLNSFYQAWLQRG